VRIGPGHLAVIAACCFISAGAAEDVMLYGTCAGLCAAGLFCGVFAVMVWLTE
jgi:hypothetical protein